jgi:P22 coat protein - gene protein 5
MNNFSLIERIGFASARVIPIELTGFLGHISRDFRGDKVQKGGKVDVTVIPRMTTSSTPAPSMSFTAGADRNAMLTQFQLNQTSQASWSLNADEQRLLENSTQAQETFRQTLEQGWRTIRNDIEAYLALRAKNAASRAIGTAGNNPFATNFDLIADAKMLLDNNGAAGRRAIIMNTTAENGLSKQSALYKVNEAGNSDLLREGVLGRLLQFDLRSSAGVVSHTKGTMTGALVNSATLPVGTTIIPYDTGTTGATGIVTGDVIAFAGDSNKYVVATGPGASATGNIILQEPGLLNALADNTAITVENNYSANIALTDNAMMAVVRPEYGLPGGNAQHAVIADEKTGLACTLTQAVGDRMVSYYMRVVYDAFAPNPYGICTIRG